jgi:uncharacterized protein YjiS (DUF1127 family)
MRTFTIPGTAIRAQGRALSIRSIARNLMIRFLTWQDRARERRMLAHLDDRMLADVGLTRAQMQWETTKGFWER